MKKKFIESVIQLIGVGLFLWAHVSCQRSINTDRAEKDSAVREAKEIILNADIEAYRNRRRY